MVKYELVLERGRFYRIKSGQMREELIKTLNYPVGEVYGGKIISLSEKYEEYVADVGESYLSIAQKFSIDSESLISLNGNTPVYPTARIFIPK